MPFVPDTQTQQSSQTSVSNFVADKPKPKGIFSRIGESLSRRLETSKRMFSTFNTEYSSGQLSNPFIKAAATGVGILGQVAGGVGDVIGEAAISAGKEILDDETEQNIANFVSRVATSKPVQTIAGKWSEFEKSSPYASAALGGTANIIGLTGTGVFGKAAMAPATSALKTGASMATKGALRAAETVAPRLTSAVKTGVQVAKDVAESAGSQLTAMSPQTIRNIVGGKVSKQAVESLDRVSIATRAKEGIDSALSDLSGLGKEYDVIRKTGQTVDIPVGMSIKTGAGTAKAISKPISDALEKFGLSMDPDGKIVKSIDSKPFDEASMASIQDFVSTYGKTGTLTADQFLNVRQAADKIVDWNSKTPDLAEAFSRTIRENYDSIGKEQIKGLADLDTKYAPMRQELGIIKRDFLTPQGQLKDTAFTTLANLTNKGREQVLARLEKYVPGITQEIHVLRAVEDIASAQGIKVGTYTRAAVSGAIALADMKSGILFFAMTHPSVVVPLLRKYGEMKRGVSRTINSIIRKVDTGEPLTSAEKKTMSDAILDQDFYQQNKTDITGRGRGRGMRSGFGGPKDDGRYNAGIKGRLQSQSDVGTGAAESPLLSEAKKYETADEFVKSSLNEVNPTGSVFIKHDPSSRIQAPLGEDMTTLDKTLGGEPSDVITVYRGTPGNRILPGDFITTNKQLAKDYAGSANVVELKIKKGDILDSKTEYGGEEYIYRPDAYKEKTFTKSQLLDIYKKAHGK